MTFRSSIFPIKLYKLQERDSTGVSVSGPQVLESSVLSLRNLRIGAQYRQCFWVMDWSKSKEHEIPRSSKWQPSAVRNSNPVNSERFVMNWK